MSQPVQFQVSGGNLPEGYCPSSWNQLFQDMVARISVTPNQNYSTFVNGSTEPSSNQGPWLKDGLTWYVWSEADGKYVPMLFDSISSLAIGTIVHWSGNIANVNTYWGGKWVWCDGAAISRVDYSTYFSIVGVTYGSGDGINTFNIPTVKNAFIVGASADDSGVAKTTVSDGSTLLKNRVFTAHHHPIAAPVDYPQDGTNFSPAHILVSTTGDDTPRAIPPFECHVALVRIS